MKVAAITGAGSGIGRALAVELAGRGVRLALSDVDAEGLKETAQLTGGEVLTTHLDVADRAAFDAWAAEVVAHYGVVHQIYNNAGVPGSGRYAADTGVEVYEQTIAIDLMGVIHGTKAFLPHLVASGDGHVVNVSSLNGFMAQPALSDYCAAKFGVRGFTESLRIEMLVTKQPVKVTVVHPGGVRTNIADAALERGRRMGIETTAADAARAEVYNRKLLKMPAERAARIIADGVAAGRSRILVGRDAKAVDLLVRLLPGLYPRLLVHYERLTFGRS